MRSGASAAVYGLRAHSRSDEAGYSLQEEAVHSQEGSEGDPPDGSLRIRQEPKHLEQLVGRRLRGHGQGRAKRRASIGAAVSRASRVERQAQNPGKPTPCSKLFQRENPFRRRSSSLARVDAGFSTLATRRRLITEPWRLNSNRSHSCRSTTRPACSRSPKVSPTTASASSAREEPQRPSGMPE